MTRLHEPDGEPVNGIPALTPYKRTVWPVAAQRQYEEMRRMDPRDRADLESGFGRVLSERAANQGDRDAA